MISDNGVAARRQSSNAVGRWHPGGIRVGQWHSSGCEWQPKLKNGGRVAFGWQQDGTVREDLNGTQVASKVVKKGQSGFCVATRCHCYQRGI